MDFFNKEDLMLLGSLMLIFSIFIGRAGYRFGMPSLLLFLAAGMIMGTDGFNLIPFENHSAAQIVGVMALSIILFTGGLDTKFSSIRPIIGAGVALATGGVMLTALITGAFIYGLAQLLDINLNLCESLLLASIMASTDSASVFALLRSKGLALKENLRPLLELESGSNDPMAYMLAISFISLLKIGTLTWGSVGEFFLQIGVGGAWGIAAGFLIVWILNRIRLENQSIYSVFVVACVFFIYSSANAAHGNGYLSVYLAGLVVGNNKFVFKRAITHFFEDFTWLWQIVMFVMLGLLVDPSQFGEIAVMGALVGFFMILIGRPLSVFACLAPFRKFSRRALMYVSWVGLRGAVPIIFATYLFSEGMEHAQMMFNIVFFITIMSLVLQGMTVGYMARVFGVADDSAPQKSSFGVELPDEIKSAMVEIVVDEKILSYGNKLSQFFIPEHTLVMMVRRGDAFFVPRGDTEIKLGDRLLVISDQKEISSDALAKQGIKYYRVERD